MDNDSTLWSINSPSSFMYSQVTQQSQQYISLDSPEGVSYTSDHDFNYDDGFNSDYSFGISCCVIESPGCL